MSVYSYSVTQWLFFFYLYSFLGWCFESVYVSIKSKKVVNRGFMRGPFLPIYGAGAVMMLAVSAPFQDNLLLTWLSGCIGATLLEYITGTATELLFKVRYWDYSNHFMNFKGQICLSSTIAWGFFTIMMTEWIHKPVEHLLYVIPHPVFIVVTLFLTVYLTADYAISFKTALDLREVLTALESARNEMERLQRRLDVVIAIADKAVEEEAAELRMKSGILRDRMKQMKNVKDYCKRRLLLDNPGMISGKFKGALEELKEAVAQKKNRKDSL